ncbi:hypothetical protein EMEDMD4_150162 [Sinorhizobium medicae]|uniref:Uncharacterized protein n=1 Tax=Sinorhizobium medicae TaxID=110321 RepID=A0A508WXH4_9HYPH|nr:hypothetical protein EMEDMD4_150162 [Sinorhizobium medicae]
MSERDRGCRRKLAMQEVAIGTTDAASFHLDEQIVRSGLGNVDISHRDSAHRLQTQCLHSWSSHSQHSIGPEQDESVNPARLPLGGLHDRPDKTMRCMQPRDRDCVLQGLPPGLIKSLSALK